MKTTSILSVAGYIATASAALGKTPWLSELGPSLNPGLGAKLPFKAATGNNVWTTSIPQVCQETTISSSECKPSEMEVFGVTYPDCAQPWVMCRCLKSPMSKQTIRDVFGQMPVHLRSTVRHVMSFPKPGGSGCNAYAFRDDIVFFGDCGSKAAPSVFLHEAAHTRDKNSYSTKTILPAVNSDTCVPDNYANSNQAEDFAQLMVVHTHKLVAGSLPKSTACMNNQMNVMARDWPASTLWPATCDLSVKPPNSPSVVKANPVSVAKIASVDSAEFVPTFPEGVHVEDFGVVV
ncbi:hypothetical protein HOY80DRAFT_948753 [Tuber brumale]|nr:hypothetical protein HOY80DRAFT_948753 [Tuber brumale]